jgi:demethylmenaquinone methyltransferase/2-methoxy-6-polyprenyl-1,4-benzoquinol methylase
MTQNWADVTVESVRQRYNAIARYYPLTEKLFCTPNSVRKAAVERLLLRDTSKVLEVGCGQGKNLPLLSEAVGPKGTVLGIDISEEMLMFAGYLVRKKKFQNVLLYPTDALTFNTDLHRPDGILFCLSYHTMPHRRDVLLRMWELLKPGGRLVVLDAKPPEALPISEWVVSKTVLGNPHVRGWEDVRRHDPSAKLEEFLFGSYYIVTAIKN